MRRRGGPGRLQRLVRPDYSRYPLFLSRHGPGGTPQWTTTTRVPATDLPPASERSVTDTVYSLVRSPNTLSLRLRLSRLSRSTRTKLPALLSPDKTNSSLSLYFLSMPHFWA